jgi:hypothetical protein
MGRKVMRAWAMADLATKKWNNRKNLAVIISNLDVLLSDASEVFQLFDDDLSRQLQSPHSGCGYAGVFPANRINN